ncbi:aldo/keto reductase [Acidobacteriota bacterium]
MKKQKVSVERRNFIKKGVAGLAGAAVLPAVLRGEEKKPVIYRTLGKTGIKLPIVSMGVMNADNPKLVEAALDAGILHLDTAHVYQRGKNEEMVGQVIKNRPRDSYVLATKVVGSNADRKTGLYTEKTTAADFIENFEISLKRLGLKYVDILYLHSAKRKEAVLFEPLMGALQKLKKQGKTRFIGVSTHRNEAEVLRAAADSKVYDVVLTAYNFKHANLAELEKAMAYAAGKGIGIVAMKTQAGVYWDKEKQKPINMKAALKWALQNENVHTAIPGFTTFDQLNLDISVMKDLTLTPKEKEDLQLGKKAKLAGLYCQQCEKCLPQCGRNFDIPTLMRSYMYAYGYKNLDLAKETFAAAELSKLPCTDCLACNVKCTMGFNVREKILDISRIQDVPSDFLA